MSERINSSAPEQQKDLESLQDAGAERIAELEKTLESAAEKSGEQSAESARHEALELAKEKEDTEKKKSAAKSESSEKDKPQANSKPTKQQLKYSFDRSMTAIRKDMSPASRTFSKIIHNPVVDKVSDAVRNSIARPNLIIAGGLGTLILCSAVYLVAKNYGYILSGFEAIGTFILGWAIGAIIEFARVGFVNQKQRR